MNFKTRTKHGQGALGRADGNEHGNAVLYCLRMRANLPSLLIYDTGE